MKYAFYYGFPVREEICHVQTSQKGPADYPPLSSGVSVAEESSGGVKEDALGTSRIPPFSVGTAGRPRS